MSFEVVSGGMVLGDRIGPIGEVAGYIKEAYNVVEDRTGVKFGDQFLKALDDGKMIFSSIPPSRALTTFKSFRPDDAMLMAHELQKSFYFDGRAPGDAKLYEELAKKFELPEKQFQEKLWSDEIAKQTENEFRRSGELGVTGFPTVFMGNDQELVPIARGFVPHEDFMMNAMNVAAHFDVELVAF
ncbi:hypothetical protein E1176_03435 [Fulvivirga sp. RKSG066]|nr:hypothetical protein [Fulvivirga aurantia]